MLRISQGIFHQGSSNTHIFWLPNTITAYKLRYLQAFKILQHNSWSIHFSDTAPHHWITGALCFETAQRSQSARVGCPLHCLRTLGTDRPVTQCHIPEHLNSDLYLFSPL